jgi:hypothetical protein
MTVAVRVEQAIDEPVVMFIFEGMPDQDSVQHVNQKAGDFLAQLGNYYAVIDIRGLETTYGEITALFASVQTPNIFNNPRVIPVFVGTPVPLDPTDTIATPIFGTPDEAHDYIRKEIAKRA